MILSGLIVSLACAASAAPSKVLPGIDVLLEERLQAVRGKRIGLVTHAAAVTSGLESTVDALFRSPDVHLKVLMGPEHGIRGDQWAGEAVSNQKDSATGLPVYSLYGKTPKPGPEILSQIDVLVYDMQDVGTRSYTYLHTLASVMEAAADAGIPLIVSDRPNPLGGERVEGHVPEAGWKRWETCSLPIPYNYGMTPGELARMINGEGWLPGGRRCDLEVIPMKGWTRDMIFEDTGLTWVPTSPHIPKAQSAFYYAVTEMIGELGVLNEGVGLPLPFELLGAPWIDENSFARKMNGLKLPGIRFRPVVYKPFYGTYAKTPCHGVQIHLLDARGAPLSAVQFHAMEALRQLYPERILWDGAASGSGTSFDRLACGESLRQRLKAGVSTADLLKDWEKRRARFLEARKKYLLY